MNLAQTRDFCPAFSFTPTACPLKPTQISQNSPPFLKVAPLIRLLFQCLVSAVDTIWHVFFVYSKFHREYLRFAMWFLSEARRKVVS